MLIVLAAAARVALVGRMVHVGSFEGVWVLHEVVTVVVDTVFEYTLVVRSRVDVEVQYTVT
jgi:hypothetical protein